MPSFQNYCSSVAELSDSLWPHGLQHTRLPCPSLSSRVCSNSYPLSQWCYPTISPSAPSLLLWPSIFPTIRIFPNESALRIRWPKYSELQLQSQSFQWMDIPMNMQGWFTLGLTGLISLLPKGLLRVFSKTTVQKHQFFSSQTSLWSNSHIRIWVLEKP